MLWTGDRTDEATGTVTGEGGGESVKPFDWWGRSTQGQNTQQQTQSGTAAQHNAAAQNTTITPEGTSAYDRAMQVLKTAGSAGASFSSDYDDEISDLYDQITNRPRFSYDYSTDPIYAQYKEAYTNLGNLAMRDTMGQAAALTGGYGNTYGEAVGQQQYDAYLARLNDVLPELYGKAYDYYNDEGNRLTQRYAMANDLRSQEYSQFRDAIGDAQYREALAIQQANDRAALGDWSAYDELYGKGASRIAQIISNPQAAWASGIADGEEIYRYTGVYPIGYEPAGSGSSGGGGGADVTGKPGPSRGYEYSGIYADPNTKW